MRSGSEGPGLEEQVPSRSIIVGLDNEPADESPTSHAENKSSDSSPSTVGKRAVVEEDEAPPGPHTGSNVSPSSSAGGKPTPTPSRSNSIQSSYKAERKQAPVEGLDLALYYLTDGDDTEKLIGLSLLKSALLNQRVLQEDLQVIARCWVSIPARFLDRLLRAADYKGDRVIDRDYMIDLAVAVLHLFANLLPKSFRNNQKFAGRISRLLTALKISRPETQNRILEVLVLLGSTSLGSSALLKADGWFTVPELATKHRIALGVIERVYAVAVAETRDISSGLPKLHSTMSVLAHVFLNTADATFLFECLAKLVRFVPEGSLEQATWLGTTVWLLLASTTKDHYADRPRMARATNLLSLALLGTFADESASLLFGSHLMDPSGQTISWIYLQQRILYIVASVPSLMQLPYGSGYNVVVQHLEGSYGIIAAFIEYLGKRRAGNDLDYASQILPYTPDLILMLVQGVSKACLLTVDYLCARYAAALANETRREISILHGQDQPQGTGESSPSQMQSDPLTTLQLRLLTMWLQEENDPKVREGAIKLMDILFGLYTQDDEILEPILMVIEQITSHANGVDQFHVTEGWTTLFDDLQSIVGIPSLTNEAHDSGMRIIKILNQVATDDIKRGNSHEDWIEFVRLACGLDAEGSVEALELRFTIAALATNLYRSHLQKESEKSPETFKGLVEASKKLLAVRDRLSEQFVEILVEAMKDLRLLKRNSARNMAMRVADAYRRDVGY